MKRIIEIVCFLGIALGILFGSETQRLTRISILNFGFDYTDFTNTSELYRSISIIPLMVERKINLNTQYLQKIGIGLYLTPFFEEEYDEYGNYIYGDLLNGYFANLRLRYIQSFNNRFDWFIDIAYGDDEIFDWSSVDLGWMDIGVHYQINYSSRLFIGFKHTLYTNGDVNMDSFFVNFIFGHSFLRK